jgi:hypothetical protein
MTAPWKLGLFVFLLVLGTSFGLVYAYLELFGRPPLDLQDPETLQNLYLIAGGVGLLALLGFVSVLSSARPVDRGGRANRRREQLMKKLARVDDPRTVDRAQFDEEPALVGLIERWAESTEAANRASVTILQHKEALSALAVRVQNASNEGLSLGPDENPELGPLVDAINRLIRETAGLSSGSSKPAQVAPDVAAKPTLDEHAQRAIEELAERQRALRDFVSQVAHAANGLQQQANSLGGGSAAQSGAESSRVHRQILERLSGLRSALDGLAEDANKLAITTALRISRLGESGAELVDLADEVRALSARFLEASSMVAACETAHRELGEGSPASEATLVSAGVHELGMILEQSAGGLRDLLESMEGNLRIVQRAGGLPVMDRPSAPVPPVEVSVRSSGPVEPASVPPTGARREGSATEGSTVEATGVPGPDSHEGAASGPERIYDLDEFGAREVQDRDERPGRIYDLNQFGAVEL